MSARDHEQRAIGASMTIAAINQHMLNGMSPLQAIEHQSEIIDKALSKALKELNNS